MIRPTQHQKTERRGGKRWEKNRLACTVICSQCQTSTIAWTQSEKILGGGFAGMVMGEDEDTQRAHFHLKYKMRKRTSQGLFCFASISNKEMRKAHGLPVCFGHRMDL